MITGMSSSAIDWKDYVAEIYDSAFGDNILLESINAPGNKLAMIFSGDRLSSGYSLQEFNRSQAGRCQD